MNSATSSLFGELRVLNVDTLPRRSSTGYEHAWIIQSTSAPRSTSDSGDSRSQRNVHDARPAHFMVGDWLLLSVSDAGAQHDEDINQVQFWTLVRGKAGSVQEVCDALHVSLPTAAARGSSSPWEETSVTVDLGIAFLSDGARGVCERVLHIQADAECGQVFARVLVHHRGLAHGSRETPVAALAVQVKHVEQIFNSASENEAWYSQRAPLEPRLQRAFVSACKTIFENSPVSDGCTLFLNDYRVLLHKVHQPARLSDLQQKARTIVTPSTSFSLVMDCSLGSERPESNVLGSAGSTNELRAWRNIDPLIDARVVSASNRHLSSAVDGQVEMENVFRQLWENSTNRNISRNILIFGPAGSGKTTQLSHLSEKFFTNTYCVESSEILGQARGAGAMHVYKVFEDAVCKASTIVAGAREPRVCVLLDDVDLMCSDVDVLQALESSLDMCVTEDRLIVIASASHVDRMLRSTLLYCPQRFAGVWELAAPQRASRIGIIATKMSNMKIDATSSKIESLADRSTGYRMADFDAVALQAIVQARIRADSVFKPVEVSFSDFARAIQKVKPFAISSCRWWKDVGSLLADASHASEPLHGLETQEVLLEKYILAGLSIGGMSNAAVTLKPPRGILLCGPSGSGKTALVHRVASRVASLGANCMLLESSEVISSLVGESERALSQVFTFARQSAPTIIFIENIEILGPSRNAVDEESGTSSSKRLLSTLLVELDGALRGLSNAHSSTRSLNDKSSGGIGDGVVLVATSDTKDAIDPALLRPGRVEIFIETTTPDISARESILHDHLGRYIQTEPHTFLNPNALCKQLALEMSGRTAPEIIGACREARTIAFRNGLKHPDATSISTAFNTEFLKQNSVPRPHVWFQE